MRPTGQVSATDEELWPSSILHIGRMRRNRVTFHILNIPSLRTTRLAPRQLLSHERHIIMSSKIKKKHARTHSHSRLRDARTRCPDKPPGKPRHNNWFDCAPRLYNEWSLGSSPDSAWTPPTPVKILFNDHVGMLISPSLKC